MWMLAILVSHSVLDNDIVWISTGELALEWVAVVIERKAMKKGDQQMKLWMSGLLLETYASALMNRRTTRKTAVATLTTGVGCNQLYFSSERHRSWRPSRVIHSLIKKRTTNRLHNAVVTSTRKQTTHCVRCVNTMLDSMSTVQIQLIDQFFYFELFTQFLSFWMNAGFKTNRFWSMPGTCQSRALFTRTR